MKITDFIVSNNMPAVTRILLLSGIAWLPLAILTLIDNTFANTDLTIPFVRDVNTYVRGLVVIPMLILADNIIEPMMSRITNYLHFSGIVPEPEQASLSHAIEKMEYAINTRWIQFVLVAVSILASWMSRTDYIDMQINMDVTSWALYLNNGDVDSTLAGIWFLLVTSPIVAFLLYRWLWRYITWSIFLYRVSHLKLELYASHTDLSCGLAMLGSGQSLFTIIFLVIATLLSSDLAGNILYEGDTLEYASLVVMIYIVISITILIVPLLFFTGKLYNTKANALAEYGELQYQISRDFHKKWIDGKDTGLVDSIQPSAMADYSAVYEIISTIRIVPITPRVIVMIAITLLIPFLPLVLTEHPVLEVLKKIGGSIL